MSAALLRTRVSPRHYKRFDLIGPSNGNATWKQRFSRSARAAVFSPVKSRIRRATYAARTSVTSGGRFDLTRRRLRFNPGATVSVPLSPCPRPPLPRLPLSPGGGELLESRRPPSTNPSYVSAFWNYDIIKCVCSLSAKWKNAHYVNNSHEINFFLLHFSRYY